MDFVLFKRNDHATKLKWISWLCMLITLTKRKKTFFFHETQWHSVNEIESLHMNI